MRNTAHPANIFSDASRVVARVIPTDDDLIITRHARRSIAERGAELAYHV
jgi:hypothetical protein